MARTAYQDCMSKKLKGKLAGKSKAHREATFRAAAKSCSGRTTKTKKFVPKRTGRTTVRQVRSVRTTKPKPKKRSRGKAERKKDDFYKEFKQIAQSLSIPLSKTSFKFTNGTWRIRISGLGKTIKRVKLGDAMKIVRKRARARI